MPLRTSLTIATCIVTRGLKPDDLRTINDLQQLPILAKSDYRKCEPEALNAT